MSYFESLAWAEYQLRQRPFYPVTYAMEPLSMIAEVHHKRLSRFRRGYRDAVDRAVAFDPFNRRRKIADWCVDNWPEGPYAGREAIEAELRRKYRSEFGTIWTIILGALLSAVISALIDHWFSDNVRMGL